MNMIELTGINKIYRTNEIETQALENVNLSTGEREPECGKGGIPQYHGAFRMWKINLAEHHGTIGCPDKWNHPDSRNAGRRHEGQGTGRFP